MSGRRSCRRRCRRRCRDVKAQSKRRWEPGSRVFGDFSEIPVHHLFRPPLQAKPRPHLPALGGDNPVYLFAPGYLVDPVGAPAFDRLNPDPNHIPDLDLRAGHLVLGPCCAEQSLPFRGQSRRGSAPPAWLRASSR